MQHGLRTGSDPNTIRVLVVGETKVGKTLLIRRLCHQVYAFSSAAVSPAAAAGTSGNGSGRHAANGGSHVEGADISEDDHYFSAKWGPTIGYEVDCLVRDAYDIANTGHNHNNTTNTHSANSGWDATTTRYYTPTGRPEDDLLLPPKTPTVSGVGGVGGGLLARRNASLSSPAGMSQSQNRALSSYSFRTGTESGSSSPVQPSSTTRRAIAGDHHDDDDSSSFPRQPYPSSGYTRPITQTVELYELGGTRSFSSDCVLPLAHMDIDGIIFVYDRANTSSTTNLSAWYAQMRRLFGKDRQTRRPLVMLVGTQLSDSSLAKLLGSVSHRGSADAEDAGADAFPSDDALADPEVRLRAQTRFAGKRARRQRSGFLARKLFSLLASLLTFVRLSFSPSLILSEQYQEERSTRSFRCLFRLLESFAALLMWVERVMLYWAAVVLFGFYQDVVSVHQPNVRAALDCIKDDPFFAAQCHVCQLHDRFAFESSVDEITGFFDTLHRSKVNPSL